MSHNKDYKQFVSQFTVAEWKLLCKHRLFLHFLRTNLKVAASIAADALQRPITYTFPAEGEKPKRTRKVKAASTSTVSLKNHPRFRIKP